MQKKKKMNIIARKKKEKKKTEPFCKLRKRAISICLHMIIIWWIRMTALRRRHLAAVQ